MTYFFYFFIFFGQQGDCRTREEAMIFAVGLCDNGFMHHGRDSYLVNSQMDFIVLGLLGTLGISQCSTKVKATCLGLVMLPDESPHLQQISLMVSFLWQRATRFSSFSFFFS